MLDILKKTKKKKALAGKPIWLMDQKLPKMFMKTLSFGYQTAAFQRMVTSARMHEYSGKSKCEK